jgi:hypothetical protein
MNKCRDFSVAKMVVLEPTWKCQSFYFISLWSLHISFTYPHDTIFPHETRYFQPFSATAGKHVFGLSFSLSLSLTLSSLSIFLSFYLSLFLSIVLERKKYNTRPIKARHNLYGSGLRNGSFIKGGSPCNLISCVSSRSLLSWCFLFLTIFLTFSLFLFYFHSIYNDSNINNDNDKNSNNNMFSVSYSNTWFTPWKFAKEKYSCFKYSKHYIENKYTCTIWKMFDIDSWTSNKNTTIFMWIYGIIKYVVTIVALIF